MCWYLFLVFIQRPLYIKATMEHRYITLCVLCVLLGSPVKGNVLGHNKILVILFFNLNCWKQSTLKIKICGIDVIKTNLH